MNPGPCLLQGHHRGRCTSPVRRFVTFAAVCLISMATLGCKDRSVAPADIRWDPVVEGQNNELYSIGRNAIERVSADIVRVPVKYTPTKGRFLVSLQELSKQFGTEVQDIGQEYTVSTWEFNCVKPEARCLALSHFKKGSKIASYEYPHSSWAPLDKAPGTKVLRDLVCSELQPEKKEPEKK